nr:unnamed protein product [Callosobruchus analis]
MLGLVNAHYKFIYINVGVNGSVSDGGVFNASWLSKKMRDGGLCIPEPQCLPDRAAKVPYVIVADEAFSLLANLLKPYPRRMHFRASVSRNKKNVTCFHYITIFINIKNIKYVYRYRYLATGCNFKALAFSFRMGPSTVGKIIKEVCAAL